MAILALPYLSGNLGDFAFLVNTSSQQQQTYLRCKDTVGQLFQ